ncbi:hypothetical protein [Haloquadratum walsbyi]|jgi:hypothetical protein|uniref:Uncharacterized protein n=1 Tax=Haloquadratum walsbyi J07HQW2 TaxID=1238425 RepID=U1N3E8_9EURY|nr:hypothetical protein [Haloquadratum walsbyi]ERG97419.1 MAG: hypothetical protein J07HQW2_03905 [Haloquadratum walsbyi J07HQW2]
MNLAESLLRVFIAPKKVRGEPVWTAYEGKQMRSNTHKREMLRENGIVHPRANSEIIEKGLEANAN